MATLLLSAVGAAVGAGVGGSVVGLSGAVIGRAFGATLGRSIDQRILGNGSKAVDSKRIERLALNGSADGAPIVKAWGRTKVDGKIIWASDLSEVSTVRGSSKKAKGKASKTVTYNVSLALALCEGEILRVGRVWANNTEISSLLLNMRVYKGGYSQAPDPKIAIVEGDENVSAFRGIAYVLIEDLNISEFGNRIPDFSFEIVKESLWNSAKKDAPLSRILRGVCLTPGTGEYGLATTPVHFKRSPGDITIANAQTFSGKTDFSTNETQLIEEIPRCDAVSLVVSWFGNDLRCGLCEVKPKVEQKSVDGFEMPWRSGGISRSQAQIVAQSKESAIYGGTPADSAVIEAMRELVLKGKSVMFYPFILMDQTQDNALPDPYSDTLSQPRLPWRGRITLEKAAGQPGSNDGTVAAEDEVANFFGSAVPEDFDISSGNILFNGEDAWGYCRFILHYAYLCKIAGGVESFCIGSEMRGLTQIRGADQSFPAVSLLKKLAGDVRSILGPSVKISYAADWSEYFGYQTANSVYFHLDELWADPNIDFIGIDNYMPISDWRTSPEQVDHDQQTVLNLTYLYDGVGRAEGYDWFYQDLQSSNSQSRSEILDQEHGENWIYRFKDIRSWWGNAHFERKLGVRSTSPTVWVPFSKPIRFTEFGCGAIDRGSNQPNMFPDAKSSEGGLPKFSSGARDDAMQLAYFQAMYAYWEDSQNNPTSPLFAGSMIDLDHSYAWAWDTRPFPDFPRNVQLWSDGPNYETGHWINGRCSNQTISGLTAEILKSYDLPHFNTDHLYGVIRGFSVENVESARAILQPLLLAHSIDSYEQEGQLFFRSESQYDVEVISVQDLVTSEASKGGVSLIRTASAAEIDSVNISYIEADANFGVKTAVAFKPNSSTNNISQSDLPLMLTNAEAHNLATKWIRLSDISRDVIQLSLPKSKIYLHVGQVIEFESAHYKIEQIEESEHLVVSGSRVPNDRDAQPILNAVQDEKWIGAKPSLPSYAQFLNLPNYTTESPVSSLWLAVAQKPWSGEKTVWTSSGEDDFSELTTLTTPSIIGVTQTELLPAASGLFDKGANLRVKISANALQNISELSLFDGANSFAIGDGQNWEICQFLGAELVATNTYDLTLLLRGQHGTMQSSAWPVGSTFVLLDSSVEEVPLANAQIGLDRVYRVGDTALGVSDVKATQQTLAVSALSLRPYSVCHLRASVSGTGISLTWARRSRVDGDSWALQEVPLSEDFEKYSVRISKGNQLLREVEVSSPQFVYTSAMQAEDVAVAPFMVEVAQISARFGAGPFRQVEVV